MEQPIEPRELNEEEVNLIASFPLQEKQKERVMKVWSKSLEPVTPKQNLPSPRGIKIVLNENIFLILILLNVYANVHIAGLIGVIGWIIAIGAMLGLSLINKSFRDHVILSLSQAGMRIYYRKRTWKYYLNHAIKITTCLLLWHMGKEALSIAWVCMALYGEYCASNLHSIIHEDLNGAKDSIIEALPPYSFKDPDLFKRK